MKEEKKERANGDIICADKFESRTIVARRLGDRVGAHTGPIIWNPIYYSRRS
jgi:hypothetical protein